MHFRYLFTKLFISPFVISFGFILPLFISLLFIPQVSLAKEVESDRGLEQQMIHQQEQEKARYNQLNTSGKEVRASESTVDNKQLHFPKESSCLMIHQVILDKDDKIPHWLPLRHITDQALEHCIGIEGVRLLVAALQNRLIEHGYITTRVLVPNQDLSQGTLTLQILSGILGKMTLSEDADHYANLWTAFPDHRGDLLDLRAMEQGLENLQRIPGVSATIGLLPGEKAGETDVVITRNQPSFWRLGSWIDDAGSKYTGRYQGGLAFYLDNPTSMNDLFYVSIGRDLQHDRTRNSRNSSLYYSVPFGFWSLDLYAGRNQYLQSISNAFYDYQYRGKNRTLSLQVNRVIHRSALQKTTLSFQVLKRDSHYYFNDTELQIQQRDTTSWKAGINHRHYISNAVLDADLTYQRNVHWFGAKPAAEEDYAGASAQSRIINLDLSAQVPFVLFGQSMSYQPRYQQQYTSDRLTSQNRFSIGNRWSVRGFDGELNLKADEGFYLRNDINLNLPKFNHQLYVGVDYGQVSGTGSEHLSHKGLAGGVVGVRGWKWGAGYDAFVGTPLYKPDSFTTSPMTLGFTLQWQF